MRGRGAIFLPALGWIALGRGIRRAVLPNLFVRVRDMLPTEMFEAYRGRGRLVPFVFIGRSGIDLHSE